MLAFSYEMSISITILFIISLFYSLKILPISCLCLKHHGYDDVHQADIGRVVRKP